MVFDYQTLLKSDVACGDRQIAGGLNRKMTEYPEKNHAKGWKVSLYNYDVNSHFHYKIQLHSSHMKKYFRLEFPALEGAKFIVYEYDK